MFDWQDYYLLARELLSLAESSSLKEAMVRSAVSRAYYAAYHRACDYLREVGEYPSDQDRQTNENRSHQVIIKVFINGTARPGWKKIGKKLGVLKSFRRRADYEKSEANMFTNMSEMKERVDDAEKIIKLINSLKN
jgi:uncharacterized protein (UPF0332 family)